MKKDNIILFILCLLVVGIASLLGSSFNFSSLDTWYRLLEKSSLNPPAWVFGPVWTILFILMAISLYLAIKAGHSYFGRESKHFFMAMSFFIVQWLLNILWSFFFFYLRSPFIAFINIIFLVIAIILTIYYFYKLKPLASYLLIPYLVWVSFASYLNLAIWLLN